MPYIDPTVRFWIGVAVTIAVAVSQGTLALSNAVPADLIPYVTAWCGIFAFVGSTLLTALNGAAMTTSSRVASAAADPKVHSIVTTADVADSFKAVDKVTSTQP